jgi:hypothetical protein
MVQKGDDSPTSLAYIVLFKRELFGMVQGIDDLILSRDTSKPTKQS